MAHGVPKRVIEMLAKVPLFSACSAKELREIGSLGTHLQIPADATIIHQGAVGKEFFLITQGSARCLRDERLIARFGPGDFFGEMALLDHEPRTATVIADEAMEVLVLDSREFRALIEDAPSISLKLMKALAERQRGLQALRD